MKLIKCRLTADIEINIFIFISSCVNLICPGLTRAFLHKKKPLLVVLMSPDHLGKYYLLSVPIFLRQSISQVIVIAVRRVYTLCLSFFLPLMQLKSRERKLWKENYEKKLTLLRGEGSIFFQTITICLSFPLISQIFLRFLSFIGYAS